MDVLKGIFIGIKDWVIKASLKKKLVLLVVILLVGWFGVSRVISTKAQQPQYQTTQAETGTLITTVSASGTISQGSSVNITTNATGVVKEVYVKDGDDVSIGDKIAEIALDISSQQKQAAAWSSYLSAKNSLTSAQNSLNSLNSAMWKAQQTLIKGAVASGLTVDDPSYIQQYSDWLAAENQYTNQQAVIAASQAALNSSWLSYVQLSSIITAPISGKVSGLTLTAGLPITSSSTSSTSSTSSSSSSTTSLGSIILDNNKLQANVNLTEIDVTKVRVGQKATLTLDAFSDKTFTGVVSAINTSGTSSSGVTAYPTTITFDTAVDNIYPNMGVNAQIITSIKDNVILVPLSAVQTVNGQSTIRLLQNNQAVPVDVEVGESNDTQTEIISGIKVGETVVIGSINATGARIQGSSNSPFGAFGTRGMSGGGGATVIRGGR